MTAGIQHSNADLGRAAAERLVHDWPKLHDLDERFSVEFASAAVERLAELIESQPALFQASRRGSERGAESLSARPFQGVLESLQNADDLGATDLRIGLRRKGRHRELLIVHNGDPITLFHVGAMVLPWVSTKADDATLSGRFGIGQKTLRTLGGPIAVHCNPYHFQMEETPSVLPAEPSISGFYDADRRETLVLVPLRREVDIEKVQEFIAELGPRALVFLRATRRLLYTDLESGETTIEHHLRERERSLVSFTVNARTLGADRVVLSDSTGRQRYTRYLVEFPLTSDDRRNHKATGASTTLGIALSARPDQGLLYDRLPLPVPCALPVGLNAQFDPDTARSTLRENVWNARRFSELGDLLAAAALDTFQHKTVNGWGAVPLQGDVPDGIGAWLQERYEEDVIAGAQKRLRDDLRIICGEDEKQLDEIVFEEEGLERVLTVGDQESLAPGLSAVAPENRDRSGRWRRVLVELDRSLQLGVEQAFALLNRDDEQLGDREPQWFLDFAYAAIEADRFEEFCEHASVLLADGTRIKPPACEEPRSLVVREDPESLATTLGLALPIHPAYLSGTVAARAVRTTLQKAKLLVDSYESDHEALALLASGSGDAVQLDDRDLLTLRDAFERLSDEDQRTLGPRIGAAIELRGFQYDDDGKRKRCWVSPAEAYLPTQVDRETDSFAKAAGKTRGISWIASDYARLLKRGNRRELGPRRFLGYLGARTFPRLISPPDEQQRYSGDRRAARHFQMWQLTDIQATELRALSQTTHLIGDHVSPDLDAVIENIAQERPGKQRRQRATALLGVLARSWERHFADHVSAKAARGHYGWIVEGEVIATWLARAATRAWLPSATGALCAPADLHLPTEPNKLTVGDRKSAYLMPVDDHILRSPALRALRVRRGPAASSIVERLEQLRDEGTPGESAETEIKTAYRLLALACPRSDVRAPRRPVDDLTVSALRRRFAGTRRARGLIFSNGRWYTPQQVFNGPPIFGRRRAFVPQSPHLDPLWHTLAIPPPDARDCLNVLRELAAAPLSPEEESIVIETMALLAKALDAMTPQLRATLRSLPLWTGNEWRTARPVYAIEDRAIASVVASQAPIWQPGFTLDGYGQLLEALNVTYIPPEEFKPVAANAYGAAEGDEWRSRFALAVQHLRTELARSDLELYKSLTISWDELAGTAVVLDRELEVAASLSGGYRLAAPTRAHLIRQPLTLFARSAEDIGAAEAGGQAVASLFRGARHTVAWAWAAMWQHAAASETADRIVLSTDIVSDEDEDELGRLKTQADTRRQRGKKKTHSARGRAQGERSSHVHVRKLKHLADWQPNSGEVVNKGAPRAAVIISERRSQLASSPAARTGGTKPRPAGKNGTSTDKSSGPSTVLPPMSEREQLAYDAVMRALALDEGEVADLRHRRGVGADAVDELRQYFEIKMSSGPEIPNEITLTPNEVERARIDRDFFLAVVAGLEEGGGDLRVRFIFDPLGRLPLRLRSDLTLGGVREAEALEYTFRTAADTTKQSTPTESS